MIPTVKNFVRRHLFKPAIIEKNSADAYDLWSANYDVQPGNLMLDLDEKLFPQLLDKALIQNKTVADIGCGTGRHWPKIYKMEPASLTGFDVSGGMLDKLKQKFPGARTHHIKDDLFSAVTDASYDTIVSTLTVAHIGNIERALEAWCRILKPKADIVITDFHPKLLAFGGKRTFKHNNQALAVKNFVHSSETIKNILYSDGFRLVSEKEIIIDEKVKHYYTQQHAQGVYEQFNGFPLIYGIQLSRGNGPE